MKADGFVAGYEEALRQFEAEEEFVNPFNADSEESRGYEEGFCDLTQK